MGNENKDSKELKVQFNVRVVADVVEQFNAKCGLLEIKNGDAVAQALRDWTLSSGGVDLGARIIALEDENQALRDTLESVGDRPDGYGFTPALDKAVGNLIKRFKQCNPLSHDHFARVLNRWSANVVHTSANTTDMNRAPLVESPKD